RKRLDSSSAAWRSGFRLTLWYAMVGNVSGSRPSSFRYRAMLVQLLLARPGDSRVVIQPSASRATRRRARSRAGPGGGGAGVGARQVGLRLRWGARWRGHTRNAREASLEGAAPFGPGRAVALIFPARPIGPPGRGPAPERPPAGAGPARPQPRARR